jgi:hypothetical protein
MSAPREPRPRECEDCGEEAPKGTHRIRCSACNQLLCPRCWGHAHRLSQMKLAEQAKREAKP